MSQRITEIDPLSEIYEELETIIHGMVVKFSVRAEEHETLEGKKKADEYLDACNQRDNYERYEYTEDEYKAVGIIEPGQIALYMESPYLVPKNAKGELLRNRRTKILTEYDEENEYYRMLAGMPPKDTKGAAIVTDAVKRSMVVVEDSDSLHKENYTEPRITATAVYNLMNTTGYTLGSYLAVFYFVLQKERTGNRSFFIVPDDFPLDKTIRGMYLRDAKTILYLDGTELPPDEELIGSYLHISSNNITDTSLYFNKGYLVVEDEDPLYERSKMVKLSEAKLNNPAADVGDTILLQNYYYVTEYYEDTYGVSIKVPIHLISQYYGARFINLIEATGYLDQLAEEHPDVKYLQFLGSKRIDIAKSRKAKNFELLYLPPGKREVISWMFQIAYSGARDYFVNTVYTPQYRFYDLYDNFIGLAICQMAIAQTIAKSMQTAIDRDFYDDTLVRWLFDMYGVPFTQSLPYQTQRRLTKNLNMLIQRKGSTQVIYDIASILGFHDITIYKYYLMKERNFNSDSEMVYGDVVKKIPHMDTNGKIVDGETIVNDLEQMYNVYFQKVDFKETNVYHALMDSSLREEYDEITSPDPLWWEDQDTFDAVYGVARKSETGQEEEDAYVGHYNFVETKYLGISISYKMSEMLYENIMLLRMIFDKKKELEDISLTLPKLTGTLEISLFDVIVFLCAMTCRQHHLTGEILTRYSSILDVMGYITEDVDGYRPCDTLAFNFDKVTNAKIYEEITKNPRKYMSEAEQAQFEKYISVLVLDQSTIEDKIEAFNQMYVNIKGLAYFLGRKISEAENIYEYRAWRDLYNALYIGQETSEMFTINEQGTQATTYADYLRVMNPALYNIVINYPDYDIYNAIDHTIARLEKVMKNLSALYNLNDSNSPIMDYFISLVKFFKSYTVDLLNIETRFIFDTRPDNLFKLAEWYAIHHVILAPEHYKLMYSDAIHMYEVEHFWDPLKFYEKMWFTGQTITIPDIFPINRITCATCPIKDCKWKCPNKKEECEGTYRIGQEHFDCHFYKYDPSGMYQFACNYRDILMNLELPEDADLQGALRGHLSRVFDAYRMVSEYNPFTDEETFDPEQLIRFIKQSLASLNTSFEKHGLEIRISEEGLAGMDKWIRLLTSTDSELERSCQNPNYPCLMHECDCRLNLFPKESEYYKETLYEGDFDAFRTETQRYYEKLWLDSYRIFKEDELHHIYETLWVDWESKLHYDDTLEMTISKVFPEESTFDYYDAIHSSQTEVHKDAFRMRDALYFVYPET